MRWRSAIAICTFLVGWPEWLPAPPSALPQSALHGSIASRQEEPITPILAPPLIDPLRVQLGERLFNDSRLSANDARSCSSCHDINTNGAGAKERDVDPDGTELTLNTLTVFNSTLNFRLGWEGNYRDVETAVTMSLVNPRIMGSSLADIAEKLDRDMGIRDRFMAAYGMGPNGENIVDALVSFERTLLTPGSRVDRWLMGDEGALTAEELDGYGLFKSMGCVSCHQGVNVGGNLFQRHGIFHPLASLDPTILRVPSLRNVAATAPYFHDGSSPTLDDAVRKMGYAQLNAVLTDRQVKAIVAYLTSLTGQYRDVPVRGGP